MNITLNLQWLEAVMLSSVRMAAFVVIAPPFSYRAFPGRIKAMLALGLAVAVSPRVVPSYTSGSDADFFGALVMELLVGMLLGFLVYVAFAAVQSAGNLIDSFGGFQLAQAYDPGTMINGAQFSRLFHMTAVALLLASGAYQLILGGLFRTFDAIPLGGGLDLAVSADLIVKSVTQMFLASVQIAGPLLIVLFLADAGLGLLSRVAPALNAFALGFPLKIFLTLALGGLVLAVIPAVVASITDTVVTTLVGVD